MIHHVTLVAARLERSARFFEEVLGLRRVASAPPFGPTGAPEAWFGDEAGAAGTLVRVVEEPGAGPGRAGIGGVHHAAFGVDDEDGLLRWKRRLADHGVHVSGPYDRGYFTSLYFRDPDGQVLEIATAGPGYAIDESPDALGRELMLPPQRIVRGHRDESAIAALTHPDPVPEITPEMALRGIHHVSGITDDLAAAGALLEQGLGLRLVKRTTNRDDPDTLHFFWAGYDGHAVAPHSAYTLFGWPPHWNRARDGVGQTRALAFHVPDPAALLAAAERLEAAGARPGRIEAHGSLHSFAFTLPDGQRVEVVAEKMDSD